MKKKTAKFYPLMVLILILLLCNDCKKEDKPLPTLTTTEVSDIDATSATAGGNITSDGGLAISDRGVCWSTGPKPTLNDSKTNDGTGAGSFTSTITDLTPNTTYSVRAYATNSAGTGYGTALSFTTLVNTCYPIASGCGTTIQVCANSTSAWYTYNGINYYCNGTDCTSAATAVLAAACPKKSHQELTSGIQQLLDLTEIARDESKANE